MSDSGLSEAKAAPESAHGEPTAPPPGRAAWTHSKLRFLLDVVALLLGASVFLGLVYAYVPSVSLEGWLGISASTLCVFGIMSLASGFDPQHHIWVMRAFVAAPGLFFTSVVLFSIAYLMPYDYYFDYLDFIRVVLASLGILWAVASPVLVKSYMSLPANGRASGSRRRDTAEKKHSGLTVATWCLAGATLLAPVIGWLLSKS